MKFGKEFAHKDIRWSDGNGFLKSLQLDKLNDKKRVFFSMKVLHCGIKSAWTIFHFNVNKF